MSRRIARPAGTVLLFCACLNADCIYYYYRQDPPPKPYSPEYLALLERFPIELHGGGVDTYGFPAGEKGQPMTMAVAC